jgi:hypothetical protein
MNGAGPRKRRARAALAALAGLLLAPPAAFARPGIPAGAEPAPDTCLAAVHQAEALYSLPPGMLSAIGAVESGRFNPATQRVEPWPWTVQAENHSVYFETKAQAVQWVRDALARGVTSIDTGCMQINLSYHPAAFRSLDEAFDPGHNADYAARFLLRLFSATRDWRKAIGYYHSQTETLATPYEQRVEAVMSRRPLPLAVAKPPKPPSMLDRLAAAWGATLPSTQQAAGGN